MYCPKCGKINDDDSHFCASCGGALTYQAQQPQQPQQSQQPQQAQQAPQMYQAPMAYSETPQPANNPNAAQKSKVTAGLLAIFLGSLGIHNFYLGFTQKAVIQLVVSLVGAFLIVPTLAMGIWALVEGIMILSGSKNTDANGVMLK